MRYLRVGWFAALFSANGAVAVIYHSYLNVALMIFIGWWLVWELNHPEDATED